MSLAKWADVPLMLTISLPSTYSAPMREASIRLLTSRSFVRRATGCCTARIRRCYPQSSRRSSTVSTRRAVAARPGDGTAHVFRTLNALIRARIMRQGDQCGQGRSWGYLAERRPVGLRAVLHRR
jgi:hypothetical protein